MISVPLFFFGLLEHGKDDELVEPARLLRRRVRKFGFDLAGPVLHLRVALFFEVGLHDEKVRGPEELAFGVCIQEPDEGAYRDVESSVVELNLSDLEEEKRVLVALGIELDEIEARRDDPVRVGLVLIPLLDAQDPMVRGLFPVHAVLRVLRDDLELLRGLHPTLGLEQALGIKEADLIRIEFLRKIIQVLGVHLQGFGIGLGVSRLPPLPVVEKDDVFERFLDDRVHREIEVRIGIDFCPRAVASIEFQEILLELVGLLELHIR